MTGPIKPGICKNGWGIKVEVLYSEFTKRWIVAFLNPGGQLSVEELAMEHHPHKDFTDTTWEELVPI